MKTQDVITQLKELPRWDFGASSGEELDPLGEWVRRDDVMKVVRDLETSLKRGPASLEYGSRSEERRVTAQRELKGLVPEVALHETRTLNDVKGGMKL